MFWQKYWIYPCNIGYSKQTNQISHMVRRPRINYSRDLILQKYARDEFLCLANMIKRVMYLVRVKTWYHIYLYNMGIWLRSLTCTIIWQIELDENFMDTQHCSRLYLPLISYFEDPVECFRDSKLVAQLSCFDLLCRTLWEVVKMSCSTMWLLSYTQEMQKLLLRIPWHLPEDNSFLSCF